MSSDDTFGGSDCRSLTRRLLVEVDRGAACSIELSRSLRRGSIVLTKRLETCLVAREQGAETLGRLLYHTSGRLPSLISRFQKENISYSQDPPRRQILQPLRECSKSSRADVRIRFLNHLRQNTSLRCGCVLSAQVVLQESGETSLHQRGRRGRSLRGMYSQLLQFFSQQHLFLEV